MYIIILGSSNLEDFLPRKQLKLVLAWAELKQEELKVNWEIAMNSELPFRIDPLK